MHAFDRPSRWAGWGLLLALAVAALACGSEVKFDDDDDGGSGGAGAGTGTGGGLVVGNSDKLDLLLVVDNSRGMGDKQAILRLAIPDMLGPLVNPMCVDPQTGEPAPPQNQPSGPLVDCPGSYVRQFNPLVDIHIAVITSSLGGIGADNCAAQRYPSENDDGKPITRAPGGGFVPTYASKGFLAWDPDSNDPANSPQGETDLSVLDERLAQLVTGAGEVGCGYEMPMEAWYRFLVAPSPYETIALEGGQAVLKGTDSALLQQRADFLRPDSALAIVMLTDEDDCSTRAGGEFFYSLQATVPTNTAQLYRLPKPRSECANDPNDPCCLSCGQPQGSCPVDPSCDADNDGAPDTLPASDDDINVRCFDQKRRFGIDFLYPTERYVDALSETEVPDRNGNIGPNPIFSDLDPNDGVTAVRGPGLVFLTAITGVPWQDIARKDGAGNPNLLVGGADAQGGFQSPEEMNELGTWDLILGDPSCYVTSASCLPRDPLMIQSTQVRSGANPVTGDPIATSSSPLVNAINGHDFRTGKDDLQYACIFELVDAAGQPAPRDCSSASAAQACECRDGDQGDNPLCHDGASFTETQFRAKAYPTPRQLEVLKGLGIRASLASICPQQLVDPSLDNYGYRPAMSAIVERLSPVFQ